MLKKLRWEDGILILGLGLLTVGIGIEMRMPKTKSVRLVKKSDPQVYIKPVNDAVLGLGVVNINSASLEQLETLPSVGPKTARKIIEYRERVGGFKDIQELRLVDGIGEKTLEKLKDKIAI